MLATALGMPALATPAASCTAQGVGVGIIDAPRGTRDPRAQTYIVDQVRPGAGFSRRFQVCNGTASAVTVQLYAGAAVIENGAFRVVEGRAGNELSGWIRVDPPRVTIPPGTRVVATAAFAVPEDVARGERYAVLLAELPAQGNGIMVANRVGVRVYLDVERGGAAPSDFTVDSLQASRGADGRPRVSALVHNTGGRALDISGDLRLADGPGGLAGGPFPATLGTTLAPKQTEPVTIVLDRAISGGPWTARLTLRSGLLERRAEARLTFPEAAGQAAPPVKAKNLPLAKDRKVLIPVAAGLIGLLLLLLLVLALLASRRKARDTRTQ